MQVGLKRQQIISQRLTIAALLGGWRQEDCAEQCYHEIHRSQAQYV